MSLPRMYLGSLKNFNKKGGSIMKFRINLITVFIVFVVTLMVAGIPSLIAQPKQQFTEWGWPQPYEKVSEKSIKYLKEKGWWPLKIAYQIEPQTFLMVKKGFLAARGIEAEAVGFLSGPPMLEAFAGKRIQAVNAGQFPTTTMIDKGLDIIGISHLHIGWRHGTYVPIDSPYKKLTDLKLAKLGRPAIIGGPVGTSGEFYFRASCKAQGIEIGKDVIIKDMSPPDAALMPKGIDAFYGWEPWFSVFPVATNKNARIIDEDWPYSIYLGYWSVPRELLEVPDVIQALTDAYVEAVLLLRYDVKAATDFCIAEGHAIQKGFPPGTVLLFNHMAAFNKPTWTLIYPDFETKELEGVAKFLSETGRTRTLVTSERYKAYYRPEFVANTFKKLGWAIPEVPPLIPKGWKGEVGKPPYPEYYYFPAATELGKEIKLHPFPEAGDLVAPWYYKGKLYKP